jgi:riboflavin biosynthesis pyrimidine reductase
VFVAPLLIGGGSAPTAVAGHGLPLPDARRLRHVEARAVGPDWLVEGDIAAPGAD